MIFSEKTSLEISEKTSLEISEKTSLEISCESSAAFVIGALRVKRNLISKISERA